MGEYHNCTHCNGTGKVPDAQAARIAELEQQLAAQPTIRLHPQTWPCDQCGRNVEHRLPYAGRLLCHECTSAQLAAQQAACERHTASWQREQDINEETIAELKGCVAQAEIIRQDQLRHCERLQQQLDAQQAVVDAARTLAVLRTPIDGWAQIDAVRTALAALSAVTPPRTTHHNTGDKGSSTLDR